MKASPIQEDNHWLTVLRYIECNPLGATLVFPLGHERSLVDESVSGANGDNPAAIKSAFTNVGQLASLGRNS